VFVLDDGVEAAHEWLERAGVEPSVAARRDCTPFGELVGSEFRELGDRSPCSGMASGTDGPVIAWLFLLFIAVIDNRLPKEVVLG
jgi:hypothetical protein